MEKIIVQQGDLILNEVKSIPKTAKRISTKGNFILLKGEGVNTHELSGDLSSAVDIYQEGETIYLKTREPVNLVHQEHGTQTLEPNKIYKRVIEREFNYEDMEARNTQD